MLHWHLCSVATLDDHRRMPCRSSDQSASWMVAQKQQGGISLPTCRSVNSVLCQYAFPVIRPQSCVEMHCVW
jgi:hypothetical protein